MEDIFKEEISLVQNYFKENQLPNELSGIDIFKDRK